MTMDNVYYVGPRYRHYAKVSGYESISKYIGKCVPTLSKERWLPGKLGWFIDSIVSRAANRPLYSLNLLGIEMSAAMQMLLKNRAIYHTLYGETDLCILPRIARHLGCKSVATFHEPPSALSWYKAGEIASKLDAVFLVSESQYKYFRNYVPLSNIFIIPHGINTAWFCPSDQKKSTKTCITVGAHHRDFHTLSGAMSILLSKIPELRFLAIGCTRKGGNNPSLDDRRFHLLNNVDDDELLAEYRRANVAVFSLSECTANNALLEAMATGLPIVATDIGGAREYLGDAGFLVPPNDERALANAIIEVLSDEKTAFDMGLASRKRSLAFDFSVVADSMLSVYSSIIND